MMPLVYSGKAHHDFGSWFRKVAIWENLEWSDNVVERLSAMHDEFFSGYIYANDLYVVLHHDISGPRERLSIRRHDFEQCNSWADFQAIKNELLGPEVEAVQVYPAESRLLDTDNVYHLFVVREKLGFNFGRAVWKNEKMEPPPRCSNCED